MSGHRAPRERIRPIMGYRRPKKPRRTRGPWSVMGMDIYHKPSYKESRHYIGRENGGVARVHTAFGVRQEMYEPDVILIAAAPELLSMLRLLRRKKMIKTPDHTGDISVNRLGDFNSVTLSRNKCACEEHRTWRKLLALLKRLK